MAQEGQHRVDPAGMSEHRIGELGEDADIGLPRRAHVADEGWCLTLEHRDEPGDRSFDRLFEHHVPG